MQILVDLLECGELLIGGSGQSRGTLNRFRWRLLRFVRLCEHLLLRDGRGPGEQQCQGGGDERRTWCDLHDDFLAETAIQNPP